MTKPAQKQQNNNQGKKPRTAITPTRDEDFPEWYQQVIKAADMAENAPVRGCMTIKPYGYAIWENMQSIFDEQLKDYGVQNCSFPMMIPLSFLEKEAEHVKGFAKECAVITHHRLEAGEKGGLVPAEAAKLEEPYVVRPTSETIIGEAMSRWIQSYRDLPMKLNQWCSVLRWEMRTRIFLRTAEFFWHEGHNAFEDKAGAEKDCLTILDMYDKFFEDYLAMPGIKGIKTPDERFPGADETYTIEMIMQDGKAIQAATTHNLGQNFSKSCDIKFQNREGNEDFAHTTSWAFTTRMIGAMIMTHGDDDGMIMPPRIAPYPVIILPVIRDEADEEKILKACHDLKAKLKTRGLRAHIDDRDARTGDKMWDAIKKGVPVRVEIGGREVDDGAVTHVRRDLGKESKTTESVDKFVDNVQGILDDVHQTLLNKARAFREENTHEVKTLDELDSFFKNGTIGLVRMNADLLTDAEYEPLKKAHGLTTRCLPLSDDGKIALVGKAY